MIGDLEPILGAEINALTTNVLTRQLTPAEELRLAEDAAKRIEYLRAEQEDFEAHQAELMAQTLCSWPTLRTPWPPDG